MTRSRISRRTLLKALGIGGAAACFPSLLPTRRAVAGGSPFPQRLVVFYTLHGTVYPNWRMRRPGLGEDADWTFDFDDPDPASFSEILRPLHDMRSQLMVLDGLAQVTAEGDVLFNEHSKGQAHSLTGQPVIMVGDDAIAGGRSVDQAIAEQIRHPDLLPSLELRAGGWGVGSVVYSGAGTRLPAEGEPMNVYQRLFPDGPSTGEQTDADRVRLAQASMLDFVSGEYESLAPRMSSADQTRLEAHRDLIRDLERRLDALATAECNAPQEPGWFGGGDDFYAWSTDAMFSLATTALACDLTRVVTIQAGQLPTNAIGGTAEDVHQAYAHEDHMGIGMEMMTNYHRVHAQQFRDLIGRLAAIPEGSGSMLDNTVVVWCGELSSGRHSFLDWPVVVAGNTNGYFDTGRYVRWRPTTPTPNPNPGWDGVRQIIGKSHTHLLVSLCNAFGIDTNEFGQTSIDTEDGTIIDLTGPLDRLR